MAKRAVRRGTSSINPMFYIPEDVDELVYEDKRTDAFIEFDDEAAEEAEYVFEYDGDDEASAGDDSDYNETPDTPQVLGIIPPQLFRMSDSGVEVVDVIFSVEDVLDADNYEFRVTKA